jgi:hypothetical protein
MHNALDLRPPLEVEQRGQSAQKALYEQFLAWGPSGKEGLTSSPTKSSPLTVPPFGTSLLISFCIKAAQSPVFKRSSSPFCRFPSGTICRPEFCGIKEVKSNGRTRDNRLWRRFSQVEQLPQSQRKQIVQILDAFLEREKLKKAS